MTRDELICTGQGSLNVPLDDSKKRKFIFLILSDDPYNGQMRQEIHERPRPNGRYDDEAEFVAGGVQEII